MFKKYSFLTPFLSALFSFSVQAQDSTLIKMLKKDHFKMNYQQQQFSGPGWDSLQLAMNKSQFVLIGEQHGLAEVPKLTSALAQVFLPKLYVAEIDPHTALVLERTAKEPGLPIALERSHPFSLSFYSWAEEFELARQLSAQKVKIIGLDQVCFLATGRIYAQMARAVKGKAAKRYLQERAAALQAHDIAYFRNPAIGQAAIFQLSSAAIDSLLDITKYEKPDVRKTAQDFAKSYQIYQLNGKGAPNSHSTRVNMMKRNLLSELEPFGLLKNQLPKMLYKFGAAHLERGLNRWNVFDIGNLAVNLADAQDHKTLHLMVVGKEGGTQGGFDLDFKKNLATYSVEELEYLSLYKNEIGTDWGVFDLRPSRRALITGKLKLEESDLKSMIMGFDYLIIIPKTTAAANI